MQRDDEWIIIRRDAFCRYDETRADVSAKFLRHLTYNHNEVVKAVMSEVKSQKRSPEFDLYK